ncbi:MAG: diaminopropionate ammonia-lyase [Promethearchaeota archaeon]|nr:MAG: diaminopropionate ammonia-lyase [Candidatus Lokiarchaeota archaeon]
MQKFLINPNSHSEIDLPAFSQHALEFHKSLPNYKPSPLHSAKNLAKTLGCNNLYIKDESRRLGLPAFKILGASYATIRVLQHNFGVKYSGIENFKKDLAEIDNIRLITATDGNHGRAVAHIANLLGLKATIYVPKHTKQARIDAIKSEGAELVIVDGNYDQAVDIAASQDGIIIQDTGYPGYENIPRYIVEGYSTMFWEIEEQLSNQNLPYPDLIIAPIGVGSFISAVVQFYKSSIQKIHPIILGVEPEQAGCAFEAIRENKIIALEGPYESVMAGLSCGKISTIAFPILKNGVDGFILVRDVEALQAMKVLSKEKIISGESGSASFAALNILFSQEGKKNREHFQINESSNILIFSTEGATDPEMYEAVMKANILEDLL